MRRGTTDGEGRARMKTKGRRDERYEKNGMKGVRRNENYLE